MRYGEIWVACAKKLILLLKVGWGNLIRPRFARPPSPKGKGFSVFNYKFFIFYYLLIWAGNSMYRRENAPLSLCSIGVQFWLFLLE